MEEKTPRSTCSARQDISIYNPKVWDGDETSRWNPVQSGHPNYQLPCEFWRAVLLEKLGPARITSQRRYKAPNLLKERSADVPDGIFISHVFCTQNLLGKSPSHGKYMLHLGRFCKNADSFPPIQKKGEWRVFKCPLQKCVIPHTKKKVVYINIYIYNIPSIIFEGPHFEFAGSVFWSKKNLDSLQSSPHPPRKWLFAGCFTRTTMSADGSTMFC